MDHTPTSGSGDDRPFKILDRTPVPDEHKERLFELVRQAQDLASHDSRDLQGEFGREAVALIVGCNQFLRLYRGGDHPGRVEVLVGDEVKQRLRDAGFTLHEPAGQVFKLFGWVAIDPMEGDLDQLASAVHSSYQAAGAKSA